LLGGAAEGASLGDGLQGDQVAQLEASPIISQHTDLHHKYLFDLCQENVDDAAMDAVIVLMFFVLLALLAPRFGVDSRRLD
jgi:hypothetical protein